jgi:DNA polymerase-3 subunit delta'
VTESFSFVVGHKKIIDVLRKQILAGKVSHAYLFVGPEGVGKTAVAMELLGAIGARAGLVAVSRLRDEKTGRLKSAVSVEQIRELCERLALTSFDGGRKVAFVEDADWMNDAAANALLKTLEEPRGDVTVVLRAETLESVPATVASRCQVLRFHAVAEEEIAASLVGRGLDREEACRLARLSNGRPGVAVRLLVDGAYRAERETAAAAFEAAMSASLPRRLALAAELLPKSEEDKATALAKILDAWESAARERMLAGDGRCVAILDRIRESREAAERNGSQGLGLEHVVVGYEWAK